MLNDGSNWQAAEVRPEARSKAVARGPMTACVDAIRNGGCAARLETVAFVKVAIALCDAFGRKRGKTFRSVMPILSPITIFMEREI